MKMTKNMGNVNGKSMFFFKVGVKSMMMLHCSSKFLWLFIRWEFL
jgi:hypothetical protein